MKKILYCSPAFPFAIPTFPVMILLPEIYVVNYGLDLAIVGLILFLAKLVDIFSDPFMGWICDIRILSRKQWIIIGSLISGLSFYYLISPQEIVTYRYLFVWISLLYLGYTIFQVPYLSMGYDLENDYEQRTKLSAGREFFVLLGLLTSVSLPVLFNEYDIDSKDFLLFLAIGSGCVTITIFSFFVKENINFKNDKLKILQSLNEIRKNKYFLKLILPWFINCLANSFPMILFVFFVSSILNGTENEKEFILFLYFLSALLGMIFWIYLVKFLEKNKIWRLSIFLSSLFFSLVFFLNSGDIFFFMIISCLTGLCLGADLAIPPSILSDVTDYHKNKFNKDISGVLFSILIFINKFTFAIATLIGFSLMDLFNYDVKADNTTSAKNVLIFMYAGIPIILKLIIFYTLRDFDLTKKAVEKLSKNLYGK